MKVSELRNFLESCPDDMEVFLAVLTVRKIDSAVVSTVANRISAGGVTDDLVAESAFDCFTISVDTKRQAVLIYDSVRLLGGKLPAKNKT